MAKILLFNLNSHAVFGQHLQGKNLQQTQHRSETHRRTHVCAAASGSVPVVTGEMHLDRAANHHEQPGNHHQGACCRGN